MHMDYVHSILEAPQVKMDRVQQEAERIAAQGDRTRAKCAPKKYSIDSESLDARIAAGMKRREATTLRHQACAALPKGSFTPPASIPSRPRMQKRRPPSAGLSAATRRGPRGEKRRVRFSAAALLLRFAEVSCHGRRSP